MCNIAKAKVIVEHPTQYYCQASIDEGKEENTLRIPREFRRCKIVAIICY
jgi:hypothetical protein